MAVRKRLHKGAQIKSAQQAPPQVNPFELKANKRNFGLLGKKKQPRKTNVVKARQAALIRRRETLLVEYKGLRKANSFVDRRFGETDEDAVLDDRAVAKLKAQRLRLGRKDRKAEKFNLVEGEEHEGDNDELTHLGKPLSASNIQDQIAHVEEGPDAAALNSALLGTLGSIEEAGGQKRKTRKEILEEIIAKSKAFRAARVQQNEEDVAATEQLDDRFRDAVAQPEFKGLIQASKARKSITATLEADGYDAIIKDIAFQPKAQPGDRTLKSEELLAKDRARIEMSEKERKRRMNDVDEDDEVEASKVVGGYAGRRKRQKMEKGRQLREAGSEEDTEGSDASDVQQNGDFQTALDKRRAQQAIAADHPLQHSFKQQAALLIEKYGIKVDQSVATVDGQKFENKAKDAGDVADEARCDARFRNVAPLEGNEKEQALSDTDRAEKRASGNDADLALPETRNNIPPRDLSAAPSSVPTTWQALHEILQNCSSSTVIDTVHRIRAENAQSLIEGQKRGLQMFYGVLLLYFARISAEATVDIARLNALTSILVSMAREVPYYAASVARKQVEQMQHELDRALTEPLTSNTHGWPSASAFLQLQLFVTMFPCSDRRHPVLTPTRLLLGKYLSFCPILDPIDAGKGLAVSCLALSMALSGKRYVPEILLYLNKMALTFLPRGAHWNSSSIDRPGQQGLLDVTHVDASSIEAGMMPLDLLGVLKNQVPQHQGPEFKIQLLIIFLNLLLKAAKSFAELQCFPELLGCLRKAIRQITMAEHIVKPDVVDKLACAYAFLEHEAESVAKERRPMMRPPKSMVQPLQEYNPRFEENYVKSKDYDPDRERARERELKRRIIREKRGAVRELRRDAVFLAAERDKASAKVGKERLQSERQFYSELQQMESDFRSGGQRGMNPHRKKKQAR